MLIVELISATFAIYALAAALPSLRLAAWAQALLFAAFAVYCTILWADPPHIPVPCGCGFSKSIVADWSGPALRAGILAALAAAAAGLLHARVNRAA